MAVCASSLSVPACLLLRHSSSAIPPRALPLHPPHAPLQINNTVHGLDSLDSVLSGAANISSGGLTAGLLGLNSSLTQLLADAQTHAPPAAPSIQSMIDATGRALVSAAGVATQLNGMVGNLDAKLHAGGKADINDLGQHVWLGGTVALALFLGFLLLSTVTLAPKRCCAVSFRLCNVLLVAAFLLVYIFAGLFMAVSLIGSDVCVDVPTALGKVANMTNAAPGALDSILYYTTCQTANGSVIPATSGAAAQLASGQATFAQTQSDFASFSSSYGLLFPAADVAAVNASLVATGGNLTALAVQAGCVPVNSIYQTVADNLCNGGMVSIVTVWALATAACILMFLIATSAARLCWRHPGDEQKQQPPAEAPRSSAAWGSSGTAVATPEAYVAMNAVGPASGTAAAYGSAAEWSATPRK